MGGEVKPDDRRFVGKVLGKQQTPRFFEWCMCSYGGAKNERAKKERILVISDLRVLVISKRKLSGLSVRESHPVSALRIFKIDEAPMSTKKKNASSVQATMVFGQADELLSVACEKDMASRIACALMKSSALATALWPVDKRPCFALDEEYLTGYIETPIGPRTALAHAYDCACDALGVASKETIRAELQGDEDPVQGAQTRRRPRGQTLDLRRAILGADDEQNGIDIDSAADSGSTDAVDDNARSDTDKSSNTEGEAATATAPVCSIPTVELCNHLRALLPALHYSNVYNGIEVKSLPIGDEGLALLSQFLRDRESARKPVRVLRLVDVRAGKQGFSTLFQALTEVHQSESSGLSLQELDLSENALAVSLDFSFLRFMRLRHLRLRRCDLTSSKATAPILQSLVETHETRQALVSLDLSYNSIKRKSSHVVAEFLEKLSDSHDTRLRFLSLAHTGCDLQAVLSSLHASRFLRTRVLRALSLRGCKMSDGAAAILARIIATTFSLCHVDVAACGLTKRQLAAILASVTRNTAAQQGHVRFSLDLSHNNCGDVLASAVSFAVRAKDDSVLLPLPSADAVASESVSTVDEEEEDDQSNSLRNSAVSLSAQSADSGGQVTHDLGALRSLDLSHNAMSTESWIALCDQLRCAKKLEALDMSACVRPGRRERRDGAVLGVSVAAVVHSLPSLKRLVLDADPSQNATALSDCLMPLLESLQRNRSLRVLSVRHHRLSDTCLAALARALGTDLQDGASSPAAASVTNNRSLRILFWDDAHPAYTLDAFLSLKNALCRNNVLCGTIPVRSLRRLAAKLGTRSSRQQQQMQLKLAECDLQTRFTTNIGNLSASDAAYLQDTSAGWSTLLDGALTLRERHRLFEPLSGAQFGVPLRDLGGVTQLPHYECPIPSVLVELWNNVLRRNGLQHTGIFRLAPDEAENAAVKAALNACDVSAVRQLEGGLVRDVDSPANLLKVWFRDLPQRLLNHAADTRQQRQRIAEARTPADALALVQSTVNKEELSVLLWLLDICAHVALHEDVNRMSAKNLAIVFVPNMTDAAHLADGELREDPMAALRFQERLTAFFAHAIEARMELVKERVAETERVFGDLLQRAMSWQPSDDKAWGLEPASEEASAEQRRLLRAHVYDSAGTDGDAAGDTDLDGVDRSDSLVDGNDGDITDDINDDGDTDGDTDGRSGIQGDRRSKHRRHVSAFVSPAAAGVAGLMQAHLRETLRTRLFQRAQPVRADGDDTATVQHLRSSSDSTAKVRAPASPPHSPRSAPVKQTRTPRTSVGSVGSTSTSHSRHSSMGRMGFGIIELPPRSALRRTGRISHDHEKQDTAAK